MFAGMVVIQTSDNHPIYDIVTFKRIRSSNSKRIFIGNHVWLAGSARLMKGAAVGDKCIVGADTYINDRIIDDETGNLACNAIIRGSPPQIIARGVTWSREMFYEQDGIEGSAQEYQDAYAQSWFHRGHVWVRRGNEYVMNDRLCEARADYLEAIAAYKKAIDHKIDYSYAYCALSKAHVHLAQIELEQSDYNAAIKSLEEAASCLKQALIHNPDHGDSLFIQGIVKEGLSGLEQLLKCDPDHADASRTIGLVHWQLAQVALHFFERSTAVKYLEMALKHDPNNVHRAGRTRPTRG